MFNSENRRYASDLLDALAVAKAFIKRNLPVSWKKMLLVYVLLVFYTTGPLLMNQISVFMACSAGDVAGCDSTYGSYLGVIFSFITIPTGVLALVVYSLVLFFTALSRWLDYKMRYNAPRK